MNLEKRKELYQKALKLWGPTAQVFMLMEEIGELMQAVSKYYRKPSAENKEHLAEEIADVEIMLEQMRVVLDVKEKDIQKQKKHKLDRLLIRVNK